jgi:hypothetical protein
MSELDALAGEGIAGNYVVLQKQQPSRTAFPGLLRNPARSAPSGVIPSANLGATQNKRD